MRTTELLLGIDLNMEDKIDLLLFKVGNLEKKVDQLQKILEAHKVEHGFAKMQDGGVNSQFGGQQSSGGMPQGMPQGMPGMGGGMGQGYQMPGQGMPMQDPSRPPGM